jgi:hypothetical protein
MNEMSQVEFEALKLTFPWTSRTLVVGIGGIVQVIDRNGNEVPLFAMTRFLEVITRKLEKKPSSQEEPQAASSSILR